MEVRFNGQVVVITGGGSGIGAQIARRFAEAGAMAVVGDISDRGRRIAEELCEVGYQAEYFPLDVTDLSRCQQLGETLAHRFGGTDVLVNCAGIFPRGSLTNTDDGLWDRVMAVNLKGAFHMCQVVIPQMLGRKGGAVINVGSVNALGGETNLLAYSTSKGGLATMTRNLASAWASRNIRVNCVHPGWVLTEGEIAMQKSLGQPENWSQIAAQSIPLGRMLTPDDVAASVVFLSSEYAKQITGQTLIVDGGSTLTH